MAVMHSVPCIVREPIVLDLEDPRLNITSACFFIRMTGLLDTPGQSQRSKTKLQPTQTKITVTLSEGASRMLSHLKVPNRTH